jgi:hypothetical protein
MCLTGNEEEVGPRMRRRVVEAKYALMIEGLYASGGDAQDLAWNVEA